MKSLEQILSPIAVELQRFEAFFSQALKADTEPMDSIMRYVQESQGKRLRPILVLLGAKLFGDINEQTLRAATFAEMLHTATLIHDDVVDDADRRRGQASVKARFGNLSAVLAGDYLLAKAMLLLNQPDDHAILQEMMRTTAAMSEGELMQDASFWQPNGCQNDAYLDIITRKTAQLMRSCCAAGALSVDASPEQVQQIAHFGLNFGILFQLRDDLLDGENTAQASSLLHTYYINTLYILQSFPPTKTVEALRDLTEFCAQRKA